MFIVFDLHFDKLDVKIISHYGENIYTPLIMF